MAKRKVVKKKAVKRKPMKKTARTKPAKKKTVKRRTAKKKPIRSVATTAVKARLETLREMTPSMPRRPLGAKTQDLARELKKTINKYLKLVLQHTGYYEETKYWTNRSIDQLMKLGKELEAVQKQYLRMAQKFLTKVMQ